MLNYLSLFSGIGAPEKALVNLGVPFHLVNYCEIDKYASKSYAAVHGVSEDLNLWDVTKITKDNIKERIDFITHGSPCFTGDTLVLVKDKGYIPIKDVSVGDKVLTHRNKYSEVTASQCTGNKDIYMINAMAFDSIECTENHRFYVRTRHRVNTHIKGKAITYRNFDEPVRSGLFYQCYRILKEVNPKYFLMENVVMKQEDESYISDSMRVKPIRINSSLLSAQLRDRLYWTNIPNATVPKDKHIVLNDILDHGYSDRDKARALLVSDCRPLSDPKKMMHRYKKFTTLIFKSKEHYEECNNEFLNLLNGKKSTAKFWDEHDTNVFDGVRYLNKKERARLQTVPEKYVECMSEKEAADLLGDGWTVDVIAHILKGIKDEIN